MPHPIFHVLCCTIASNEGSPLISRMIWSETMGSPGTTDSAAPDPTAINLASSQEKLIFEIYAAQEVFISINRRPNATYDTAKRIIISAGETRHLECKTGDRVAWSLV